MEKVYKLIKQKVVISPNIRSVVDLKAEVYSQDIDVTKIVVELESANGELIDLTDATVTVGLKVNNVTIEDVGQVEDVSNMLISYCPGERFKINEGTVTLGFFVTLNTGQRIDIQNYKINFKRSLIDTATDEEVKPYFTSLDTIVTELKEHTASKQYEVDDSVNHAKSEIDDKVNTVETAKTTAVEQIDSYEENAKTTMDGVVSDVRSTGETQKQAINEVVSDVQSTADTAKTDINAVLPTVSSHAESQKQAINSAVSDVNGYADLQKQIIHNVVTDVQSTGDTAKEDIKATLPTLQTQVSELSESITEISDELNNLIVTEFPQKESTRDKWNFYIINHTFETDSKIVISTSGINCGINYTKNGEYINVADYGITQDSVITVSKGDRIDVIQVVTFGDCTISCKVYGDKVKKETIPDGLIIHNYGTIVKQYYYGLKYNPSAWGGRFRSDNASFITNPLPIIKDKDIYIDSTYTANALFYDENGEYLGYKELYYNKPLLYSDIPENAYYICFSLLKNSPDIENGDTAKLNTSTFDNRYMRRTVSERNYMEGTRLKTYIYNTDSIETIVHKMNEAIATENVDVYWEYGNYDLNGLYDVLNNLYRFSGQTPRGIYIGGNCRYYFNNALLTKDMSDVPSGSNYPSDILEGVTNKVASNCDYEIYDLNIHGTGIIYCVHDDVGTSTIIPTYRKYVNCKMKYTATEKSEYLSKCIGGGTGRTTYREIDNCSFFMDGESPTMSISTYQEVSFHGSSGDTEEGYFQLKVHDCYFEHSIGQHYLDTNQKADFYMSNCSLGHYTKSSDEKWKSYVWNNEIRG